MYVPRLTDLGSVSQTLGLFLPIYGKNTSSHPAANTSKPHTVIHLAMATNTLVGALSTSQTMLNR